MGTPQIPSVDSDTKQFPNAVRARMAQNIADPSTPEGAALAAIVTGPNQTNLASFAKSLRNRQSVTIALAGDSTGDEWAEWFSRMGDMYQASVPSYSEIYNGWDDPSQSWTVTNRQSGAPSTIDTLPLFDDFSQRTGELVGSNPTRQPAAKWTNVSGLFSLNTSKQAISTGGDGSGNVVLPSSMPQASKLTLSGVMLVDSTVPSSTKYLNVGFFTSGGARRLSLQVRVAGTSGAVSTVVEGQIPAYVSLGAGPALTLPTANAVNKVPFSLVLQGTALTVTVSGTSKAFTLTTDQASSIAAANGIQLLPSNCAGWGFESVRLEMQYSGSTPALSLYNGSRAGTTLSYQQSVMANMFPASLNVDALFISSSHNYNATSAADYLAAVTSYIRDFAATHPNTAIILVAQNPEAPPVPDANRIAHLDRITALKGYAQSKGYGFLDALGAFYSYGQNWAQKLVRPDGLHPNAAGNSYDGQLVDPDNGAFVWANAGLQYLTALRG